MADIEAGVAIVSLLIVLLLVGMPIAFSLITAGIVGLLMTRGWTASEFMLGTFLYSYVANLSLVVVPLFLLMGNAAFSAGLSERAFVAARKLLSGVSGGLAMAVVFGCAAFATVCGSSVATAVTMGRIALPEMTKAGYRDTLATGCVAAGGTLGVLIPPSGILVIYSIVTQVSVVDLFIAAFIPGVITAVVYAIYIYGAVKLQPDLAPMVDEAPPSFREKLKAIAGAWEVLALFLVVMGSIYLGVATATEAAAFGAFFAIVLLLRRTRSAGAKPLNDGLIDAAGTTASVFALVIGAGMFSLALATTQIPTAMAASVAALDLPPAVLVAAILIPYLILGCFIDGVSMLLLTMPVVFPIITTIGFNPIIFGLLVTKAVEIGCITPPVGLNAFAVKGVAPDVPLGNIFRGCAPFVLLEIALVAGLLIYPDPALWLLQWMG
jgi:tripartite ATP-independent transporter DctM subunit